MKKVCLLIFALGFLLVLSSAGASDLGMLASKPATIRALIGIVMVLGGYAGCKDMLEDK